MRHPKGPLGFDMAILEKPWGGGKVPTYKRSDGLQPHATCLDCGGEFWGHTWDKLFEDVAWHGCRKSASPVVHVWDDLG